MRKIGKLFIGLARLLVVVVFLIAWFSPFSAKALSYTVSEETDFYFTIGSDDTLVVIYGNSNESCNEVTTDPYLWLYDDNPESTGQLIAQNDDGNHNSNDQCVSSKIYTTLNAGDYRLRAGYCCSQVGLGNTSDWGDGTYELVTDLVFDGVSPNTPTTTSTTTPTTTTTTVPQTIGPPMNLTGSIVEVWVGDEVSGGVYLDWDAPNTGNVDPERYAISFRIPPSAGWGVATGNVGDENALNTEYTLPFSLFENTGGFGQEYVFDVRADNDTLGVYSGWSTQVTLTVEEPTPPTTTTTTTTTLPPTTTSTTTTTTTTTTLPPTTTTTVAPTTTTSTTTTSSTTTTTTVPPTTTTTEVPPSTTTTTSTVPPTTSTSTTTTTSSSTTTSVPATTIAPTTTTSTVAISITTTSSPPTNTVPSLPITVKETVNLQQIDEAEVKAIEKIAKIDEDIAEEFLEVVDGEVTKEEITALITDDNFDQLDDDTLYLVGQAVNAAPDDVKQEFEDEVNIFGNEAFDTYVPSGSRVDTATRRVIVAAAAASAVVSSVGSRRVK